MKSTHISIKYRYDKTNIKIIKAGNLDLLVYSVDGLAIDASNSSQVSYDSNWYNETNVSLPKMVMAANSEVKTDWGDENVEAKAVSEQTTVTVAVSLRRTASAATTAALSAWCLWSSNLSIPNKIIKKGDSIPLPPFFISHPVQFYPIYYLSAFFKSSVFFLSYASPLGIRYLKNT